MKSMLIYGDSNTWGKDAGNSRYPREYRWVMRLQQQLGEEWDVIAAGLSGRTAGSHTQIEPLKRGKETFEVVYRQAFPLDVVIIALGSNDIKDKYNLSSEQIVEDLLWYAKWLEQAKNYNENLAHMALLFVAPPNFVYNHEGFTGNEQKRQDIIQRLQHSGYEVVIENDIDLSADGVHFSLKGHEQMTEAVHKKIKEMGV